MAADKTLIGFAGGPFTIALYMIEGRASKDYKKSINFYKNNREDFLILLKKLSMVTEH